MQSSRRGFLKTTAAAGSALAASQTVVSRTALAQDDSKKLRLAAIGVGGSRGRYNRGGGIARDAAKHAKMVAVCDVDDLHTKEFNEVVWRQVEDVSRLSRDARQGKAASRDDRDAGSLARANRDRSPAQRLRRLLRETAHVDHRRRQTDPQSRGRNRSCLPSWHAAAKRQGLAFLKAIAMVQSGRLGKNVNAYIAIGGAPDGRPL